MPTSNNKNDNENQGNGRRCLVVAYHAPGSTRPASIRIRRLLCGLRDSGWKVGLLSTSGADVDMPDGIDYKLINKPGRSSSGSERSTKSASDSTSPLVRSVASFSHKFPIPMRAWWLGWAGQGVRWGRQFQPDIIFSKSNPPESHMMAAILARRLDVPWVAEFGDLWAENHFSRKTGVLYSLEKAMELLLMRRVDALTSVSQPLAHRLSELHGKPTGVVTNCFPLDNALPPVAPEGEHIELHLPLRILFTGRVYIGLNMPDMLMDALDQLRQKGLLARGEVRVSFYCPNHDFLSEWLRDNYPDLGETYEVNPPVSLTESLRLQKQADVLYASIWFGPGHEGVTTSKFFEYLSTRRQVWASLAGPGALTEVCRQTGAADDLYSVEDCMSKLLELLESARAGKKILYPAERWQKVLTYSCLGQSRVLGGIMSDVLAGRRDLSQSALPIP